MTSSFMSGDKVMRSLLTIGHMHACMHACCIISISCHLNIYSPSQHSNGMFSCGQPLKSESTQLVDMTRALEYKRGRSLPSDDVACNWLRAPSHNVGERVDSNYHNKPRGMYGGCVWATCVQGRMGIEMSFPFFKLDFHM